MSDRATRAFVEVDGARSRVESEQWVNKPIDDVFEFFSDALNLERLTPTFLKFHVISISSLAMGEGTLLRYRLKLHGIPIEWTSRIENWRPPYAFSDRQIHGPYQSWYHRHEFIEKDGGTLIKDKVDFKIPFHFVSRYLFMPMVKRDLENIFQFRQTTIAAIFGDK